MSEDVLKRGYFFNNAFISELSFFISAQLLAIFVASRLEKSYVTPEEASALTVSPLTFVLIFVLMTFFVYWILKKFRSGKLLAVVFYAALIQGIFFTLSNLYDKNIAYVATFVLLLIYFLVYTIIIHDILLTIALSGIGVILASMFTIQSAIIIICLLAIYDYIAVNKSGHMIIMFKRMMAIHIPFAMVFPYERKNFKNSIRLLQINSDYVFLGTGDVIVPMILIIPTFITNAEHGYYTLVGAVFGVIMLYLQFLYRKERKALPGLPPIVFGTLLGYFFWFLS